MTKPDSCSSQQTDLHAYSKCTVLQMTKASDPLSLLLSRMASTNSKTCICYRYDSPFLAGCSIVNTGIQSEQIENINNLQCTANQAVIDLYISS